MKPVLTKREFIAAQILAGMHSGGWRATQDRMGEVIAYPIILADALIAKLEATPVPALDLQMTDDDPTNALADRVVREIQGHPAIRTEYAGVLQNAVIRALRPTIEEWSKAAKPAEQRNCGTCWHRGPLTQICHKRNLAVHPDMSCPDWSPIS